jgi:hypothetical protein
MKLLPIGSYRRLFMPTGRFCRLSSDGLPLDSTIFAVAR